jgi:hypothetical protein
MDNTIEFVTDHLVIWLMYRIRDILSIDAEMQRSKQSSDCQNVAQPCKSNNHNFLSSDTRR